MSQYWTAGTIINVQSLPIHVQCMYNVSHLIYTLYLLRHSSLFVVDIEKKYCIVMGNF